MTEASHNAARWWTKNKLRQEDISRKPLANNDDLQLQADVLKLNVTQLDVKSGFQRDIASASRDPQKSLAYGDFESLDGEIELREEHFDRNNELNNLKKETSADYFQQNPNNFVHNRRRVNSDSMIGKMDLRKDSTLSEDIAMIEVLPARKIWKESLAQAESLDATDRSVGLENFKKKPSFLVPHTSCHNQVLTLKITTSKKWWLQWKGNNRFFCDGRIMVGVHVRQLVCSTLLLVSTWVVFLLFVSLDFVGYWCPAVGIVLVIVSVCTLAHCAMSDPGIIPPRPRNSVVDTMPAAVRIQLNYCMTCHIVRPQRTKHCRHCNTCVRRFDHHCPWVGNCIGQRNYRSFLIFITVVSISSIFVSVLSILYTLDSFGRINNLSLLKQGGRYGNQYVSIALSIWSSLVALLVTGLLALHFYLFHKGMTTNEFLKGTQTPDERGFWSRCWGIWFGIIPDSLLPPMHMYPSNDDVAVNQGHASASLDTLLKEHSQFSDSIV